MRTEFCVVWIKYFPGASLLGALLGESRERLFNITPGQNKSIHEGIKWIVNLLLLSVFATNRRGSQGPPGCNAVERLGRGFSTRSCDEFVCQFDWVWTVATVQYFNKHTTVYSCDSLLILPPSEISSSCQNLPRENGYFSSAFIAELI